MLILRGGPHKGINCKLDLFSEFEFIFEMALGYGSGDWGMCFDEKTRGEISCASVPLRPTGQCFHKKELFKLWRLPTPLVCGQTQHGKQYFVLQHHCTLCTVLVCKPLCIQ
jgi:hypothetical protein